MDILLPKHKQLLIELISANIKFLLVGGYAVNFHGYIRSTNDLDIWLQPSNENKLKLLDFLRLKKFNEDDLRYIENNDFEKPFVFHIYNSPQRVDFITVVTGVNFEEAYDQRKLLPLKDMAVPVIHLHHLILTKISTGRPQDIADIERLQEINKDKK